MTAVTVTRDSVTKQAPDLSTAGTTVTGEAPNLPSVRWNPTIAAAYLAHRVNELLGPTPAHGAVVALAREAGLPNSQTLSQIRTGARKGVAVETFDTFASYWGRKHDELLADAYAWWEKEHPGGPPPGRRETRVVRDDGQPVFGNVPGWLEAEAKARKMRRFAHVSEDAWTKARGSSGAHIDPANITPALVGEKAEWIDRAEKGEGLDTSDDD